ncbi:MAG: PKD domain-containing protein [Chitinophagales bacterium]
MKYTFHLKKVIFFLFLVFPLFLFAQDQEKDCNIKLLFDYAVEDLNVSFSNLSENYHSAFWDFGDGHTSTKKSPKHQYQKTNAYQFCLTLTNDSIENCKKVFCGQVYVFDPCE